MYYPYNILVDKKFLPFKDIESKESCDKEIDTLIDVIEKQKELDEVATKMLEDIDLKLLLKTQPLAHRHRAYPYKEAPTQVEIFTWTRWKEQYAETDDKNELIHDAVKSKFNKNTVHFNVMLLGYGLGHVTTRLIFKY